MTPTPGTRPARKRSAAGRCSRSRRARGFWWCDGAELGKALAAHPEDVEAALTAYERAMFPRSAAAATEGTQVHEMFYGAGALHSLINLFTGHR